MDTLGKTETWRYDGTPHCFAGRITVLASVVIVASGTNPGDLCICWGLCASAAKAYDTLAHRSRSVDLQGFLDEDA